MRLIDVEWALASASSGLVRTIDGEKWIRVSEVKESIRNAPTVDAVPVRHGHWDWDGDYICSNCGERGHRNKWNYCPNCGAKMDETEERLVMPPADGSTIKIGKMDEVEDGS